MDLKVVSQLDIFNHVVRSICLTAKNSIYLTELYRSSYSALPRDNTNAPKKNNTSSDGNPLGTGNTDDADNEYCGDDAYLSASSYSSAYDRAFIKSITKKMVYNTALEEATRICKTLMDASGHAFLMMSDAHHRERSLRSGGGWEENERDEDDSDIQDGSPDGTDSNVGGRVRTESSEGPDGPLEGDRKRSSTIKYRRQVHSRQEAILEEGVQIYIKKSKSLKKCIRHLIDNHFISDTPQEVASFLRIYRNKFDPGSIGEYMSEKGDGANEEEYWAQIRFRYVRATSFSELDVEGALRLFFTGTETPLSLFRCILLAFDD